MKIRSRTMKLLLSMLIICCLAPAAGCRCIRNEPPFTSPPTEPDDTPGSTPTGVPNASSTASAAPALSPLTVVILKVGKADAIILQTDDKVMLIDTGETDDGEEIVHFLKSRGITSIECMIITHYDKDHVGGACEALGAFNVKRILLPNYEGTNQE